MPKNTLRIISLVPSATESLFALGLGDEVVAVTHECDYPPRALDLPKVTRDALRPGLSAGEIDRAVRERTAAGKSIYELDEAALHSLQPTLIITQALCAVCAVSFEDVAAIADKITSRPQVISLDPHTIDEILADIATLGRVTGRTTESKQLIDTSRERIKRIEFLVSRGRPRTVAALEWLDPVFIAGHWTPEMIAHAGGVDVLGTPGAHSEVCTWADVIKVQPEIIVVMPCGYDAQRSLQEAENFSEQLRSTNAEKVVAVDAAGHFSRPGPRCIDGVELLGHIIHPDLVPRSSLRCLGDSPYRDFRLRR